MSFNIMVAASEAQPVQPDHVVDPADLSFESTVPRSIVHRHAVSEVFLTDSARISGTRFLIAAHLPRMHGLFGDTRTQESCDPQYFVETCRQAGVLIAHRYFSVPRGHGFVFQNARLHVVDHEALRLGAAVNRVVLTADIGEVQYRNEVPYSMTVSILATVDDRPAVEFAGAQLMMPREVFTQLRAAGMTRLAALPGRQNGPCLDPGLVGRTDPRNVVLASDEPEPVSSTGQLNAELIVDQTHPVFFDHPQDHAPGLLLVEAFLQAATAAVNGRYGIGAAPTLESVELHFDQFVELGTTVEVLARLASAPGDAHSVDVQLVQGGAIVAAATVLVRR